MHVAGCFIAVHKREMLNTEHVPCALCHECLFADTFRPAQRRVDVFVDISVHKTKPNVDVQTRRYVFTLLIYFHLSFQ